MKELTVNEINKVTGGKCSWYDCSRIAVKVIFEVGLLPGGRTGTGYIL